MRIIIKILFYGIAAMLILYTAWLCTRMLFFDYFTVPSVSMSPTITPGSKVIVNKVVFGARIYTDFTFNRDGQELQSFRLKGIRDIQRNDIVVFNFPIHKGKISFRINHVYCKRIIGLPGDTVSAVNGYIRNNNYPNVLGIKEKQQQLQSMSDKVLRHYGVYEIAPRHTSEIQWNIKNWGPMYIPRKDDIIPITPHEATIYRKILEWEEGCEIQYDSAKNKVFAQGKPLTYHRFKHNYYHICGDYSLDSFDSRYWGLVPEEFIVGVVAYIIQ